MPNYPANDCDVGAYTVELNRETADVGVNDSEVAFCLDDLERGLLAYGSRTGLSPAVGLLSLHLRFGTLLAQPSLRSGAVVMAEA